MDNRTGPGGDGMAWVIKNWNDNFCQMGRKYWYMGQSCQAGPHRLKRPQLNIISKYKLLKISFKYLINWHANCFYHLQQNNSNIQT
jgi:hypothetical protein